MFDQVYLRPDAREQAGPVERIVEDLLRHFVDHPEELPSWFEGDDVTRATDWVASVRCASDEAHPSPRAHSRARASSSVS